MLHPTESLNDGRRQCGKHLKPLEGKGRMATRVEALVTPALLRWSREAAGFDLPTAAAKAAVILGPHSKGGLREGAYVSVPARRCLSEPPAYVRVRCGAGAHSHTCPYTNADGNARPDAYSPC